MRRYRVRAYIRRTAFAIGLVSGVGLSAAFLVWSFPGFRYPTYQEERYRHATNRQTGEPNPVVRPSFWETYTIPADTYAQWLMATLSIVATVVSAWAVFLVRNSLDLNRRATEAAVAANEQSRKLFEIENRPRIKIVGFGRGGYEEEDGRYVAFLIIKVRNVGGGTARNVNVSAECINSMFVLGNRAVIAFSGQVGTSGDIADHILFAEDDDELIPVNPRIDETTGLALVCIAYRGEIDPKTIYKTACAVSLNGEGGRMNPGSMYAT